MKEITVEGYKVRVDDGEDAHFVITVPALPGCIGQVKKGEDIHAEASRLIGEYLAELAKKKPKMKAPKERPREGGDDKKVKMK
jgi:predicted RNase H-like HicB family nuclease